jgi:cyclohexyl-isocyanide hydratase
MVRIAILVYHEVLELDLAGPHTVFRTASRYAVEAGHPELEVFTVARSRSSVLGAGGLVMTPNYAFMGAPDPDVLVVPGGPGAEKAGKDSVTRTYLREQAARVRFLAAVSTGSLTLGEAGLLEGLTVTTWVPRLEQLWQYNPADVVATRLLRVSSGRYFAAEVSAGMDLALEVVAESLGRPVAEKTAAHLGIAWMPLD